jgi:hypothetical protein
MAPITLPPETVEITRARCRIPRRCRVRRQPKWKAIAREPPPERAMPIVGAGPASKDGMASAPGAEIMFADFPGAGDTGGDEAPLVDTLVPIVAASLPVMLGLPP